MEEHHEPDQISGEPSVFLLSGDGRGFSRWRKSRERKPHAQVAVGRRCSGAGTQSTGTSSLENFCEPGTGSYRRRNVSFDAQRVAIVEPAFSASDLRFERGE